MNPDWAAELRELMSAAIQKKALTQTRIAKMAGVSQPSVSEFLSGQTKEPMVPMFMAACQLLSLDPFDLVGIPAPIRRHRPDATTAVPPPTRALEDLGRALVRAVRSSQHGEQTSDPHAPRPGRRKGNRKNRGGRS